MQRIVRKPMFEFAIKKFNQLIFLSNWNLFIHILFAISVAVLMAE